MVGCWSPRYNQVQSNQGLVLHLVLFPWRDYTCPGWLHQGQFPENSPIMIFQAQTLSFPGSLVGKETICNAEDWGLIPGWGRSPGEGNGNPTLHSCLESSMDRGTWWATVHGVAKSWTGLKWPSTHLNTQPLSTDTSHEQERKQDHRNQAWLSCVYNHLSWSLPIRQVSPVMVLWPGMIMTPFCNCNTLSISCRIWLCFRDLTLNCIHTQGESQSLPVSTLSAAG